MEWIDLEVKGQRGLPATIESAKSHHCDMTMDCKTVERNQHTDTNMETKGTVIMIIIVFGIMRCKQRE